MRAAQRGGNGVDEAVNLRLFAGVLHHDLGFNRFFAAFTLNFIDRLEQDGFVNGFAVFIEILDVVEQTVLGEIDLFLRL